MGRKKLEWYPGAIYHVTARGNRRSEIFREKLCMVTGTCEEVEIIRGDKFAL